MHTKKKRTLKKRRVVKKKLGGVLGSTDSELSEINHFSSDEDKYIHAEDLIDRQYKDVNEFNSGLINIYRSYQYFFTTQIRETMHTINLDSNIVEILHHNISILQEMVRELEHNRLLSRTLLRMFQLSMRTKINRSIALFEESNADYNEMPDFLNDYCRGKQNLSEMVVNFNSIMDIRRFILECIEEIHNIDRYLTILAQSILI